MLDGTTTLDATAALLDATNALLDATNAPFDATSALFDATSVLHVTKSPSGSSAGGGRLSHREGAEGDGSLDHGEYAGHLRLSLDLGLSLSERVAQVRSQDERASVPGGRAPRDFAHAEKQAWMGLKGAGTRLSWLRRRIDTSKSSALWRRRAPRERSEESR